jgi:hypothetical protein
MPFHVTLLGVYRGSDEDDPINNITDDIPHIHQLVHDNSATMGSTWAGDRKSKLKFEGVVLDRAYYL